MIAHRCAYCRRHMCLALGYEEIRPVRIIRLNGRVDHAVHRLLVCFRCNRRLPLEASS